MITDLFNKKNLLKEAEEYRKNTINNGYYTMIDSKYFNNLAKSHVKYESLKYIYNLIISWENISKMPYDIGKYFEELIESDNFRIGIHRTNIVPNVYDSGTAQSIFKEGLINTADLAQGIVNNFPPVSKTVSLFDNILNFNILIRTSYKGSTGSFIFCFPTEAVDKEGKVNNESSYQIYDATQIGDFTKNVIKPDYLLGYLDNTDNNLNFISKEDYLNKINLNSRNTI